MENGNGKEFTSSDMEQILNEAADLGERDVQRVRAVAARAAWGHEAEAKIEMEAILAELKAKKWRRSRKRRSDYLRVVK